MPFVRTALWYAAREIARNPRLRAMAYEIVVHEVAPRAQIAWRNAKPRLDAARAEMSGIARECDAKRHPAIFARRVGARILRGKRTT